MPVTGSTISNAADAFSVLLERVNSNVKFLFDQTPSKVLGLFKSGNKTVKINDRFYRCPYVKWQGGTHQYYNPEGTTYGSGSGMQTKHLTGGYFNTSYAISFTEKLEDSTQEIGGQTTLNFVSTQVARAMDEVMLIDEITLFTDGSGILTSASTATGSSGGGTTYTFGSATDGIGITRLRTGMTVVAYANTSTPRANGTNPGFPAVITNLDVDNNVVYLDSAITGAAAADFLVFAGTGTNAGLLTLPAQTGQSTWPLSGDSARHGIPYANATTGYFLGVDRTTNLELKATTVNVSPNIYTPFYTLQIRDKLIAKRDEAAIQGIIGIIHMNVRAQYYQVQSAITGILQTRQVENTKDLIPSGVQYETELPIGGIMHYICKRQSKDRADYVIPGNWERAALNDQGWLKNEGGGYLWQVRSSTGGAAPRKEGYFLQKHDYVCLDPGAGAFINGIQISTGY